MQVSNEIGMESEKIDKESLEEDVARMLENINLFQSLTDKPTAFTVGLSVFLSILYVKYSLISTDRA